MNPLPLGLAFSGITLLLLPWSLASQITTSFGYDTGWFLRGQLEVVEFLGTDGFITAYRLVLSALFVIAGLVAAGRGHRTAGPFVGVVGVVAGYQELLLIGGPQDRLYPEGVGPADFCWTARFVGAALWWIAGG